MHVYLYMWIQCLRGPEEDVRTSDAEIIGGYEPPAMDTGD